MERKYASWILHLLNRYLLPCRALSPTHQLVHKHPSANMSEEKDRKLGHENSCCSMLTRILWLFVVIMIFFCGVNIINRHVSKLLPNLTTLSINLMEAQMFQDKIPYPSLTLCHKSNLKLQYPAGKNGTHSYVSQDFHPAITDNGLCHVWNGETMLQTFKPSKRINSLTDSLGLREKGSIKKIQGAGTRFGKTMWLDMGGR